jgi:hypothetical protein
VISILVALTALATTAKPEEPRATMDAVFGAFQILLPLSLDEKRFASPENQARIAAQIEVLAGAVQALDTHGQDRDQGFQYLSRSLAADVEEIRQRYQSGRLGETRFFVLEATRNCVACHSRLPGQGDFPLGTKLVEDLDLSKLSHHERSQVYVATRQFEKALANWESLFEDDVVSAAQLDAGGYLTDYLTIAIRVQGDYARAQRGLTLVRVRPDVPDYLAPQLGLWIRELSRIEQSPPDWRKLGPARELASRPKTVDIEGDALSATIGDLVASGLLIRFLDEKRAKPGQEPVLAEAYYWLGRVEARSADSFWVPQAPWHLELAIRLDPKGKYAESALALYEEQMAFGYGGTDAEMLPVDLWTKLDELRELVATRGGS